jgi:hypothetical protein
MRRYFLIISPYLQIPQNPSSINCVFWPYSAGGRVDLRDKGTVDLELVRVGLGILKTIEPNCYLPSS